MFDLEGIKAKLNIRGWIDQFNQSVVMILLVLLFLFYLLLMNDDRVIKVYGLLIDGIVIIYVIHNALSYQRRQEPRVSGDAPRIEYENVDGKIALINLPDKCYTPEYIQAVRQGLLVGFDEDLTPDGEVIGKASDDRYRKYSVEEQENWHKNHVEEITGVKRLIEKKLLAESDESGEIGSTS